MSWMTILSSPLWVMMIVSPFPRLRQECRRRWFSCGRALPLRLPDHQGAHGRRHLRGYGFDRLDAYALLGQLAVSTVANIVDPAYTVIAKFPKRYLPK
jgi:hypothetical protein